MIIGLDHLVTLVDTTILDRKSPLQNAKRQAIKQHAMAVVNQWPPRGQSNPTSVLNQQHRRGRVGLLSKFGPATASDLVACMAADRLIQRKWRTVRSIDRESPIRASIAAGMVPLLNAYNAVHCFLNCSNFVCVHVIQKQYRHVIL